MNLKHRVDLRIFGIDFGDRNTIKSHAWLAIQPILVAGIAILISLIIRHWFSGMYFHPEDRESAITGPMAMLAIFHSVIAGGMLMEVVKRHREVTTTIFRVDKKAFDEIRYLRLPGFLKFFIAGLSTFLVIYTILLRLHYVWSENFTIFTITWALSMYWVVLTELEDPTSGAWFNNRLPPELLDTAEDERA